MRSSHLNSIVNWAVNAFRCQCQGLSDNPASSSLPSSTSAAFSGKAISSGSCEQQNDKVKSSVQTEASQHAVHAEGLAAGAAGLRKSKVLQTGHQGVSVLFVTTQQSLPITRSGDITPAATAMHKGGQQK